MVSPNATICWLQRDNNTLLHLLTGVNISPAKPYRKQVTFHQTLLTLSILSWSNMRQSHGHLRRLFCSRERGLGNGKLLKK